MEIDDEAKKMIIVRELEQLLPKIDTNKLGCACLASFFGVGTITLGVAGVLSYAHDFKYLALGCLIGAAVGIIGAINVGINYSNFSQEFKQIQEQLEQIRRNPLYAGLEQKMSEE